MKIFIYCISFLFSISLCSQGFEVKGKTINPSDNINDGVIQLKVEGGTPPYIFKWSNQQTPLSSPTASGLVEGIPYTVTVTDASGQSVTQEYKIDTQSITEIFNGNMTPAVSALGSVLFWDPFEATGIYDPVVYADEKRIATPGWSATIEDRFVLKQWLVDEGAEVVKGEKIALVSSKDGSVDTVLSTANGKIKYLVDAGKVIYNSENKEHVIQQGAHYLAEIQYAAPVIIRHPNGDPITKNIPFIVIWLVLGATFFTLRMGFINIRGFRHSLDLARGKYDDPRCTWAGNAFSGVGNCCIWYGRSWKYCRRSGGCFLRWCRCYFLDDRLWIIGDVVQICRMYTGGKIQRYTARRPRFWWTHELFEIWS